MRKVLLVDDQPAVLTALEILLDVNGIPTATASSPEQALELVEREELGAVIQDMNFTQEASSGEEGIALFHDIRERDPDLPVILLTAWTHLESAVELVKAGAADYLAKPWDDDKLVQTVRNLLRTRDLVLENRRLLAAGRRQRATLAARCDLCGLIYESSEMHAVATLAVQVAPADVPVLISGPNGSGKEKIAEIVQANSRRADQPFIKVNAGALPDNLLEAELFGAEPGAYTGATKRRQGRFEAADGGTLFLDEVGNLSLAGQMKLLRVLQSGEYERLGSSTTLRCDVRVLSATDADLQRAIADGRFREDLFYRLSVIEIKVPPLTEHLDDILPLAHHFLCAIAETEERPQPVLAKQAQDALLAHDWSGNVRELRNRVQRALLVTRGDVIQSADLDLRGTPSPTGCPPSATPAAKNHATDDERAQIEGALLEAEGVVARAAALIGISRQTLYRRMERLGIVMERRPKG